MRPCGFLLLLSLSVVNYAYDSPPTIKGSVEWNPDNGVPVFFHVTKADPFNATDLDLLAKASVVTFDKGELDGSLAGHSFEERALAAAKSVKARSPATAVLYYLNGLINFNIFWGLYNTTTADPEKYLLFNSTGGPVSVLPPFTTYDPSKQAMRQLFVADCMQAVNSGAFDGCFIDRADYARDALGLYPSRAADRQHWTPATMKPTIAGQRQLLADLTAALGDGHIVLAKEAAVVGDDYTDWQVANAAMPTDTFCSNYNNNSIATYNMTKCLAAMEVIKANSARGQLTEAHGMGPLDDATQREFTLACFLVAMGPYGFFTYASEDKDGSWSLAGTAWWPEFDKPLGHPVADAVVKGYVWRRGFTSGTNVTVDVEKHTASIQWASQ